MANMPAITSSINDIENLSKRVQVAANITIVDLTPERLARLKPVTVLDIFDGISGDFHEHGLFSIQTFGRAGSEERDNTFSYIDIKVEVFHPFIHKNIVALKGLYGGIMSGRAYAVWNDKEKDFEPSDIVNGQTGYFFFMQHWKNIVFKTTSSNQRKSRIVLIDKFKKLGTATCTKVLVIPAGLRDVEVEEGGRVKQNEINDLYRPIIQASNAISTSSDLNTPIIDLSRNNVQTGFNNVYLHIRGLLEGKGGFIQSKYGRRHIAYGTRNVITAMDTSADNLEDDNSFSINSTGIGLWQLMKAIEPKVVYYMRRWLEKIFSASEGQAYLVNPKTLKQELVNITTKTYDRWQSSTGIGKLIHLFGLDYIRTRAVKIEGYYPALIYVGPDKTFKIFYDIDDLPKDRDKSDVHPITFVEMFYLIGFTEWNKNPIDVTRYPITGDGSIYTSYAYVKTTVTSEVRYMLNSDWEMDIESKALEFPILQDAKFVDSLIPHPSRLAGLGGDFDGDTTSANALLSDEAILEAFQHLHTVKAYVRADGTLTNSAAVDTVDRVLFNFTGDPE